MDIGDLRVLEELINDNTIQNLYVLIHPSLVAKQRIFS